MLFLPAAVRNATLGSLHLLVDSDGIHIDMGPTSGMPDLHGVRAG